MNRNDKERLAEMETETLTILWDALALDVNQTITVQEGTTDKVGEMMEIRNYIFNLLDKRETDKELDELAKKCGELQSQVETLEYALSHSRDVMRLIRKLILNDKIDAHNVNRKYPKTFTGGLTHLNKWLHLFMRYQKDSNNGWEW